MTDKRDEAVLGELLNLLAHDLRNPLSALQSNLGYLQSAIPESDRDAREAAGDGLISCDGLAHVIDNIDLLGLALRQTVRTDGAAIDLVALVTDVASACRTMAQSHGVGLEVEKNLKTGGVADGSREYLTRALANLVRNSIQHSPPGNVVRIVLRADPAHFVLRVEDAGSKFPESLRTAAFTPSGQVNAKNVPSGRYSRGAGLYAAAIAASLGRGTVRIAEDSGAGNAFELVLARRA